MSKDFNTKELTPGEFFDRFTILIRKAHFEPDKYNARLKDFISIITANGFNDRLLYSLCFLMMANTDVWNLEGDIRKGREGELGLSEVGRRAIEIRKCNTKRIVAVNDINEIFGVDQKEGKFDHGSD